MVQWTPKRRSRALGLIQSKRHSLSEITKITHIPNVTGQARMGFRDSDRRCGIRMTRIRTRNEGLRILAGTGELTG